MSLWATRFEHCLGQYHVSIFFNIISRGWSFSQLSSFFRLLISWPATGMMMERGRNYDTQEAPTDSTGEPRAPSKKKTICRWPEKLQRQLCSPLSLHTTLIIISSRWARRSRAAQCKLAPFTPPTVLMPTVHNCPKIKHAWNSDTSVNMLASCCLRSYQCITTGRR